MKTEKEIRDMAEKNSPFLSNQDGFIAGYTACQEMDSVDTTDLELERKIELLFEKHTSKPCGIYEPDYISQAGLIPDLIELFRSIPTPPKK